MLKINVNERIGKAGRLLSEGEKRRGILINTLQEVQEKEGYLSKEVLEELSKQLDLSLAEIYGVASFYKQFHFTPRGRKVVRVCVGTACHVRGSKNILDALKGEFNIKEEETTADLALTLETVGCVGCCGLAPVTVVNEVTIGEINSEKLASLMEAIKEKKR